MNPERKITLGGKTYTVREYGHVEWLKIAAKAQSLVNLLEAQIQAQKETSFNDVLNTLGEHIDALLPLILQVADMTLDEFNALSLDEIEAFIRVWWGVNCRFFFHRANTRLRVVHHELAVTEALALEKSMQP